MKRRLRSFLKACWRATEIVRRPIMRKVDGYLTRHLALTARGPAMERFDRQDQAIERIERTLERFDMAITSLEQATRAARDAGMETSRRLEHVLSASGQRIEAMFHETNLVLNSTVRELTRLQMCIEVLEQAVDEATTAPERLSIVDPEGEVVEVARVEDQRMKAS